MCFSLSNKEYIDNVKNKWVPELNHYIPQVPKILVGTKLDIRRESFADDDPSVDDAVLSDLVSQSKVFITLPYIKMPTISKSITGKCFENDNKC